MTDRPLSLEDAFVGFAWGVLFCVAVIAVVVAFGGHVVWTP
jgi:hypothetical protein